MAGDRGGPAASSPPWRSRPAPSRPPSRSRGCSSPPPASSPRCYTGCRDCPACSIPGRAGELGIDVALGYLAVGALFLPIDRLGLRPLDFPAPIVFLTAVHFHVAGFGLLAAVALRARGGAVASSAAAHRGSPSELLAAAATLGIVAGMPLTALGFVAGSPLVNALGAVLVGISGIATGIVVATDAHAGRSGTGRAHRAALGLAAGCLFVAMPLGMAWAVAPLLGVAFLDLELMARTHGVLNAIAVIVLALVPSLPDHTVG